MTHPDGEVVDYTYNRAGIYKACKERKKAISKKDYIKVN
jgi:hypothetical protein